MPPKKPSKKSKAEIAAEKAAQEELERKRQEELARKADEERLQQLERERLLKLQHEEARKAELGRLQQELAEMREFKADNRAQLRVEEEHEASEAGWKRYIRQPSTPDPTDQREFNTHMSLLAEIKPRNLAEAMTIVTETVQLAQQLADETCNYATDPKHSRYLLLTNQQQRCQDFCCEMLESAMAEYLRFLDTNVNDRAEVQGEFGTAEGIWMGLWTSLAQTRPIRKSLQFTGSGVQLDLPKQVLQADCFVYRVLWYPWDRVQQLTAREPSSRPESSAASSLVPVGGVYQFDILRPPKQAFPLRGRGWTVRERTAASSELQYTQYPSNAMCKFVFTLPDFVVMHEGMRLARWEEGRWTEEGSQEYSYNEANRTVQMHIASVGLLALVQDATAGFPFKSWSLSPVRLLEETVSDDAFPTVQLSKYHEMHARLTVETQLLSLTFEIMGAHALLVDSSAPQLAPLYNQLLRPSVLLNRLARGGVNLVPARNVTHLLEGVEEKEQAMETEAIRQVAALSSAFDFRSNRWNQSLGRGRLAFDVRESSEYMGGLAEAFDYETVLVENDGVSQSFNNAPQLGTLPDPSVKLTMVQGDNYGKNDQFSSKPRSGENTHVHLLAVIQNHCSPEAVDRVHRSSPRFHKAVEQMLRLMSVFTTT